MDVLLIGIGLLLCFFGLVMVGWALLTKLPPDPDEDFPDWVNRG
jgi:hypothetical protein